MKLKPILAIGGKFKQVISLALGLLMAAQIVSGADRLTDSIQEGFAEKERIDAMTDKDVPEKWRSTAEDQSDDRHVRRLFKRGERKAMVVSWNKRDADEQPGKFSAMVFDGDRVVCHIVSFSDGSVNVMPMETKGRFYGVITSIKQDGRVLVSISEDTRYIEEILVDGQATRLIEDLEFTKTAMAMDTILEPLVDGLIDHIEGIRSKKDPAETTKSKD